MSDRKLASLVDGAADIPGSGEHYSASGKSVKNVLDSDIAVPENDTFAANVKSVRDYVDAIVSEVDLEYDVWNASNGKRYIGVDALADAIADVELTPSDPYSFVLNGDFSAFSWAAGDRDIDISFGLNSSIGSISWVPTTNSRKMKLNFAVVTSGMVIGGVASGLLIECVNCTVGSLLAQGFSSSSSVTRGTLSLKNCFVQTALSAEDWDVDIKTSFGSQTGFVLSFYNSNVDFTNPLKPFVNIVMTDNFFDSEPLFYLNSVLQDKSSPVLNPAFSFSCLCLGVGFNVPFPRKSFYYSQMGGDTPVFVPMSTSGPEDAVTRQELFKRRSYFNVTKASHATSVEKTLQQMFDEASDQESVLIVDSSYCSSSASIGDKTIDVNGISNNVIGQPVAGGAGTGVLTWVPSSSGKRLSLSNLTINSIVVGGSSPDCKLELNNCIVGSITTSGTSIITVESANSKIINDISVDGASLWIRDADFSASSSITISNTLVPAGVYSRFTNCYLGDSLPVLDGSTHPVGCLVAVCRYGVEQNLATYSAIDSGAGETRLPVIPGATPNIFDYPQRHELGQYREFSEYSVVNGDYIELTNDVNSLLHGFVELTVVPGVLQINKKRGGYAAISSIAPANFEMDSITTNRLYCKTVVAGGSNEEHNIPSPITDGTAVSVNYRY
jgi:hypothetical protein